MTRILAILMATASLAALSPEPFQQPVFRGTTDLVSVFATVTDRDGRMVTALAQSDFEVRDEGKPQPITQFDNTPQPVRLVVMLDVSGSMEGNLPMLRAGTSQLLTKLLPGDAVKVGTFGQEINISPAFTRDPLELRAALPTAIDPTAPTPLWRAIDEAMSAFDDSRERAVVLVLSDGKDSPAMSFRQRPMSQGEVIDRARRENVMIYGVGMRSRRTQPPPMGAGGLAGMVLSDLPDPGLARVAEDTGGGYLELRPSQDLGAVFAAVADELHSQYLLGYVPPKRDGKVHDIDVRVVKGGMKVRARDKYVAPKN